MKANRMPGRMGFLLMLGALAFWAVIHAQGHPPHAQGQAGPAPTNDLSRIPEVCLEPPLAASPVEARRHIARQIEKINELNAGKTDGFLEVLQSERSDLRGLPFARGDACRSKESRNKPFTLAAETVRNALEPVGEDDSRPPSPETFWQRLRSSALEQDRANRLQRLEDDGMVPARIPVLMQVLAARTEMHPGLVGYLSTLAHVEATQALARLAIFSDDKDVRATAIEALKTRRGDDSTSILLDGLRYPWPRVAERAAEAIARLRRRDLMPRLLDVLGQADPRAPVMWQVNGKEVPVVRELVRVNHHRSCLLCHAPGNTGKVPPDLVRAEVPVPGEPLIDRWEKCKEKDGGPLRKDILVRIDVTYLRPDFSRLLAVADAHPWPQMQRFDFLVRQRVLTEEEAAASREKLQPQEAGTWSPYQRAALAALRELTGGQTQP